MAVAIDIIIVALLIVCLFIGKRKGFVYTAVELIGWVVIAVVGVAFSKNIAEWIYDSFVRSAICSGVDKAVADVYNDTLAGAVNSFFDKLPAFISGALSSNNISADSIVSSIQSGTELSSAVADALRPVFSSLISALISLIIFIIGMFLVRLVARACGGIVNAIPLVGGLNSALGAVAGVIKGLIITVILVSILSLLVQVSSDGFFGITEDTLNSTFIFKAISSVFS